MDYHLELFRCSGCRIRKVTVSVPSVISGTEPTDTKPTSRPSTVADLKEIIQASYNIPKFFQKISYDGQVLEDSIPLKELYLREGDIIRVCYSEEGDCKEIIETVQWLKKVDSSLKLEGAFPLNPEVKYYMQQGLQEDVLTKLSKEYFYPWFVSRTYMNVRHFIALSGFDILVSILDVILAEPWDNIYIIAQSIVMEVLFCLWNMCESVDIKKVLLAREHFLELCLKCFTLSNVEDQMASDAVLHALGILCK